MLSGPIMKFDIAESHGDVQVLLEVLSGTHRQKKSDHRGNVITGVLIGAAMVWAAFSAWEQAGEITAQMGAVVLGLFGIGFPLALWISGRTEYSFTPQAIAQRNPLWLSWTVAAGDVYRIAVEFTQQWVMIITTHTDQTRRIPIVESMSIALGNLYPELFGPSRPVRFSKRLGYVMYTILALTIIAFTILLIVLYRRGMLVW